MLPVNRSRSFEQSENRLIAGSVVEYQQHGKSILAVVHSPKNGKWMLINEQGDSVHLPSTRLMLVPGVLLKDPFSSKEVLTLLKSINDKTTAVIASLKLEDAWEVLVGEVTEVSTQDILELLCPNSESEHILAVRRLLLNDSILFKRLKSGDTFEPRSPEVVEELKTKEKVESEKRLRNNGLIDALAMRINNAKSNAPIPNLVLLVEQLAALGNKAPQYQTATQIVDEVLTRISTKISGSIESKAFSVLVQARHFNKDQNLSLIRSGRTKIFSETICEEAEKLYQIAKDIATTSIIRESTNKDFTRIDLRNLTVISIDNEETKDYDDALSLETTQDGYRIGIHIADAASIVTPDTLMFREAITRATSIYCPDETVSMMPSMLSEEALSLRAGEDKAAISIFIDMTKDFVISNRTIQSSIVHVVHNLSYDEVDEVLYGENAHGEFIDPTHRISKYESMMLTLYDIASSLMTRRIELGSMQFDRREMYPKLLPSGKVVLESSADNTPARKLVSELMVLANETLALFAKSNNIPLIFRSQDAPDVEPHSIGLNIPEGPARDYAQRSVFKRSATTANPLRHYGLALEAYAQGTSPIRRVSDLVNQTQINNFLRTGAPLFSIEEIDNLIAQTESSLSDAIDIQRERTRYWILKYLQQEKIKELNATVLRVDGMRPLAEIEITYSIFQFYPTGYQHGQPPSHNLNAGAAVKLRVDKLDPASLTIRLTQM